MEELKAPAKSGEDSGAWKVQSGAQELASAAPTGRHNSSLLPMRSPEKPATIHSAEGGVEDNNSKTTAKYLNAEY